MKKTFLNIIKTLKKQMATISLNETDYAGKSITIHNNRVYIDGVDHTPDAKEIIITVTGDITTLAASSVVKEITITGNVDNISTASGSVRCGNIGTHVETVSGDVNCENISGDVKTISGNVNGTTISGNVKTVSGNIKTQK